MPAIRTITPLYAVALFLFTACVRRVESDIALMPVTLQFSNDARKRVDVYLVTQEREWLLGRVEPLNVARLPLPSRALSVRGGWASLAVVSGVSLSQSPSRERGVVMSIQQPVVALLSQRWMFVGGQLSSLRRPTVKR